MCDTKCCKPKTSVRLDASQLGQSKFAAMHVSIEIPVAEERSEQEHKATAQLLPSGLPDRS